MRRKKRKSGSLPIYALVASQPFSQVAEQYRKIRTSIEFSSVDKKIRSLVVTSPWSSEGKTTTASNLAVVFANAGSRVALIDADMRKPMIASAFRLSNAYGLSNYLAEGVDRSGSSDWGKQAIYWSPKGTQISERLIASEIKNLYVLPSGPTPPNPAELLSSQRMQEVLHELEEEFDMVIIDTPPIVTVTDAQLLASYVDGTVLVVRERTTSKQRLSEAKSLLDQVQARVIGVIYNGKKQERSSTYY